MARVAGLCLAVPVVVSQELLLGAKREEPVIPHVSLPGGGKLPMLGMGDGSAWGRSTDWVEWFKVAGKGARMHSAWGYGTQMNIPPILRDAGIAREDIFLSSMIPCGGYAGGPEPMNASFAEHAFAENLQQMNTTYLDLVLLHHRCRTPSETKVVWKVLEQAKQRGQVVDIGVSNFEVADLEMLLQVATEPVSVNQAHWGVGNMDFGTLDFCQRHGIAVESYNTVHSMFPVDHPVLQAVADRHEVTPYQAVMRYVGQRGISILTATTSREHMQQDIAMFSFNLTDEELADVDALQLGPRGCADCYTIECRTCRFVLSQIGCTGGDIGNPGAAECLTCTKQFNETVMNGCGDVAMAAKSCGA